MIHRFQLRRLEDPTGISGTGIVATGSLFASGKVVVEWGGNHKTVTVHENLESVRAIHCHGGKTLMEWMTSDPICEYGTVGCDGKGGPCFAKATHFVHDIGNNFGWRACVVHAKPFSRYPDAAVFKIVGLEFDKEPVRNL